MAIPPHLVRKYMKQMLIAMAWLHENGIAHRDIKSNNILLDFKGDVMLSDFGLSEKISLVSRRRFHQSGTFNFFAPEQILRMEEIIDYKAGDIWGIGCIFFELLHR